MKSPLLRACLFLVSMSVLPDVALAQEKIRFKKIPVADLEMKFYDQDTSAHAVILYDKGHLHGTTGVFTRHVRLKILKTAGTNHANFQVRTLSRSDIEGATFNLVNGQVQETALSRENIFREEIVQGYYTYKIFFPAVRPGSVIDLTYSFNGVPYQWRFQETIPVKFSELTLEPTKYLVFKKTMFGSQPVRQDGYRWTATNVPAFRTEPYMSHYSNYLTHFKIDVESVTFAGALSWEFSSSWEKVAERLMESDQFGIVLKNTPFLNDKASEIRKSNARAIDKIRTAFDHIKDNIKWNGHSTHMVTPEFWANYKRNHSGNSAEVNLLLISLLQKSGIKTYPAVLSTRDNGLLNPVSASLSGLNYVVAYVKTDSLELFLDATDPDITPGILPARCKNISAYVIDHPRASWWVDISSGKAEVKKQFIKIEQNTAGDFVAEISNTFQDYGFLEWIKTFKEKGEESAYISSIIANSTDVPLTDCKLSIDRKKLTATEVRTASLSGSDVIQDLGEEMLINAFYFSNISNPFKLTERDYPIDFIYPRTQSIIFSLKVPDGYSLRKVPDALSLSPVDGARFGFVSSLNHNILTVICTLKIEKQIFTQEEYGPLRDFFSAVNRKLLEPLQIDKKI